MKRIFFNYFKAAVILHLRIFYCGGFSLFLNKHDQENTAVFSTVLGLYTFVSLGSINNITQINLLGYAIFRKTLNSICEDLKPEVCFYSSSQNKSIILAFSTICFPRALTHAQDTCSQLLEKHFHVFQHTEPQLEV